MNYFLRSQIREAQKALIPIAAALISARFSVREELRWMITVGLIIVGLCFAFTLYALDQIRRDKKRTDKPRTF